MQEQWKDIKGYEGIYQISNLGRIKNLNTNKILFKAPDKSGYIRIHLYKNGSFKAFGVHRLVADAFIPNPNNKKHVNHIDENKSNNCVSNLEWATPKENNNHGSRTTRQSNSKKIKIKCVELDMVFDSAKDASEILNVDRSSITACCKGKRKTVGGYHFKYVNPKDQLVYGRPVFNITTGVKYNSLTDAKNAYGLAVTDWIAESCKRGVESCNCQWCFYEDGMENWSPDDFLFIWD